MSKPINTHIFKYVFLTISINFVFLVLLSISGYEAVQSHTVNFPCPQILYYALCGYNLCMS